MAGTEAPEAGAPGAGAHRARRALSERFAEVLVAGRWVIIGFWVAAVVACLTVLPASAGGGGGLNGLLSSDTPAVEAEIRSFELFGFPLIARTVVVQRDESGMSPYAQARTVVRAVAVDQGKAGDVRPILGALPLTNTLGLFPGAREADTTSLTYLLFAPETSLGARVGAARGYADRFFDKDIDNVVGVTGSAPARTSQGSIIREALPGVETITVLAIVLIVGIAFRSALAPLLALVTAGVAYVVTLRTSAYLSDRLDLASPDELEPVVVALLLGVVTDYVIFFCSSLRDSGPQVDGSGRQARRQAARLATTAAIARTGPIVAVAGLAVAAGTATLLAAQSPFFRALGPALAFTVAIGVLVALTLVPAILAVLGDRVFWPSRRRPDEADAADEAEQEGRVDASAPPTGLVGSLARGARRATALWRRSASVRAARWPGRVIDRVTASRRVAAGVLVVTLGILALGASLAPRLDLGVSFLGALPPQEPVRATAASAYEGFSEGILSPTVVLVESDGVASERRSLSRFGEFLSSIEGVAGVLGPGSQPRAIERQLLVTPDGDAARYLVVLDEDPLGAGAVDTVNRLQRDLPAFAVASGLDQPVLSVAGDSATASFVVQQTQDDLVRIALAAVGANLLMLLIFLRSVVASILLLGTTLLSLGATIGVTGAVFDSVAPGQGLTFYVPFAAAILLLAFGSDYNIFTVGHVWEAAPGRTMAEAVRAALPSSVSAVFTAGMALGASFGLLSLVPLTPFRQLAFALALGIAIEILLVRLLILPAMLSLLGPRAAWPSRRFRSRSRRHVRARGTVLSGRPMELRPR